MHLLTQSDMYVLESSAQLLPAGQAVRASTHTMPTPRTTVAMLRASAKVNFFFCRTNSSTHTHGMISSFVICRAGQGSDRTTQQHAQHKGVCNAPAKQLVDMNHHKAHFTHVLTH